MAHTPDVQLHFLMTLDPVHVGTGGFRLGRVDNSIVREPGSNLPKIPGTALHGAIRQYAAHRYGKPQCAGQKGHCARPTCPICYTFGAVTEKRSHAGAVAISDVRILLFPVYSMAGPVWITSPSALEAAGLGPTEVAADQAKWGGSNSDLPTDKPINLGWLMTEREGDLPTIHWPEEIPEKIHRRVILISDKLFSQVVNANLEVRTSVSINPETGAAEEGALFTYEAIPRATILWTEIVWSDYRGEFPSKEMLQEWEKLLSHNNCNEDVKNLLLKWRLWSQNEHQERCEDASQKAHNWLGDEKTDNDASSSIWRWESNTMQNVEHSISGIVKAGLQWAEHLGIGGMGTRGFGRVRLLSQSKNHETTNRDTENPQQ